MSLKRCLALCLSLAVVLAACSPAGSNPAATSAPKATSAATSAPAQAANTAAASQATAAPAANTAAASPATAAPAQNTAAPAQDTAAPAAGLPPQTGAAAIRPPERRAELTRLSNLLQFQVVGLKNASLGKIADFIINTCETYIIYFVVDPDSSLKLAAGSKLVIPFEAVTINSGALDAAAKAIVLYLNPDQVKASPVASGAPTLLPTAWEGGVRAYWQRVVRVGKLDSQCRTGGGAPIQKIAYATQLIGAALKDGNHNLLGTVQDGILEPESGKLGFYLVALKDNAGLVLVPLAKTNIPDAALQPGAKIELVLLANNGQLAGAPHLGSPDQATDAGAQGAARGYWGH